MTPGVSDAARILAKVSVEDGCWPWQGNIVHGGYGMSWLDGRPQMAHRAVFQVLGGRIPDGLTLDHLCRNRRCVNPQHLDPCTQRENHARGLINQNVSKTHCANGHPFDERNTYRRPDDGTHPFGKRGCRACHRQNQARYLRRREASRAGLPR